MNQKLLRTHELSLRVCKISAVLFPIFAVLCAAGFFFAMKNDYNFSIGHFNHGSVPAAIVMIAVFAALILSCVCALLAWKSASVTENPAHNPVTVFGAVLSALLCVGCLFYAAVNLSLGTLSVPARISAVLTPFIGVSMILSLFPKFSTSPVRQLCAIFAFFSVNISMFADYFDFTLPLNSPIRNLTTVMKAVTLLYLLSEARISFGQNSGRISLSLAVFSSGLTASAALGYAAGAILVSAAGSLSSNPLPPLFELALYAALGIHAAGRLFTLIPTIGPYIAPPEDPKKKKQK